jgi:hypothetical protein
MIKPTVGRIVWFFPASNTQSAGFATPLPGEPLPAIITNVIDSGVEHGAVHLTVFDAIGVAHPTPYVQFIQEGFDVPADGRYATWMPYQVEQAKKNAGDRQLCVAANREADDKRWRAGMLDMALRTPGLTHYQSVLRAAAAYQAHIEGEKAAPVLPTSHPVQKLADAVGGTIEHVERLPDGSGAAVLSVPLPANHWLTALGENVPPMKFRMGTDNPSRKGWEEDIRAAGRYAVRCATMNGTEDDFDPDALVQNLIIGMLGYFTHTGLSDDANANPPMAAG